MILRFGRIIHENKSGTFPKLCETTGSSTHVMANKSLLLPWHMGTGMWAEGETYGQGNRTDYWLLGDVFPGPIPFWKR